MGTKEIFVSTERRKQDHLDLCLREDVQSLSPAGWDDVLLPHRALPELNLDEVRCETKFLGLTLGSPILISSMTGGTPRGDLINDRLAALAQSKNIAMGVGSQRIALENRDTSSFSLRKKSPNAVLFANIGVVQLNFGVSADDCQWLVDRLEASALILHANALQEAIQSEGDRDFGGLWKKIESLKKSISVPLILKETGCGLDSVSASRAIECGVDALDCAGRGGTHWGFIEGLRHPERKILGEMFRNWGLSSVQSLRECVEASQGRVPVVASGGIRNALDILRALSLGADLGGMALPFLKAAEAGEESLEEFYNIQVEALRIGMFCQGLKNLRK